jgi:hypothetical protein
MKRCPSGDRKPISRRPQGSSVGAFRTSACSEIARMVIAHVLDAQVCQVTVVPELGRRNDLRAPTQHECDGSRSAERPVARVGVAPLTAEHASEPKRGSVQVMHGKNRIRAYELHRISVPSEDLWIRLVRLIHRVPRSWLGMTARGAPKWDPDSPGQLDRPLGRPHVPGRLGR